MSITEGDHKLVLEFDLISTPGPNNPFKPGLETYFQANPHNSRESAPAEFLLGKSAAERRTIEANNDEYGIRSALYDLSTDPGEAQNLVTGNPDIETQFLTDLYTYLQRVQRGRAVPEDKDLPQEVREALEATGYL